MRMDAANNNPESLAGRMIIQHNNNPWRHIQVDLLSPPCSHHSNSYVPYCSIHNVTHSSLHNTKCDHCFCWLCKTHPLHHTYSSCSLCSPIICSTHHDDTYNSYCCFVICYEWMNKVCENNVMYFFCWNYRRNLSNFIDTFWIFKCLQLLLPLSEIPFRSQVSSSHHITWMWNGEWCFDCPLPWLFRAWLGKQMWNLSVQIRVLEPIRFWLEIWIDI
jgi:hypothetical protein